MEKSEELVFDARSKYALKRMAEGERNLLITGKAGTGKSTLLSEFLKTTSNTAAVVAPTGVAALRVNGMTIHRFFDFPINVLPSTIEGMNKPRRPGIYKSLETLIIDEVSMLRADLHDCIEIFLRKFGPLTGVPFGGVHMIYIGDLYQLPPVVLREERENYQKIYNSPYFFSAKCTEEIGLEIIELEQIHRQQDPKFINILENVRNNVVSTDDIKELNKHVDAKFEPEEDEFYVTLTSTNKKADTINAEKLDQLWTRKWKNTAEITGEFTRDYFPSAVDLEYKIGAQIMMLNNDTFGRWANGSTGVITGCGNDKKTGKFVNVRLNDTIKDITVGINKWEVYKLDFQSETLNYVLAGTFKQLPFRLAWAVTIHKSQGLTLDKVIIDLTQIFTHGQTYVALSRCRSLDGIVLTKPIQRGHIRTDIQVQKFFATYSQKIDNVADDQVSRLKLLESAVESQNPVKIEYIDGNNQRTFRDITPLIIGKLEYRGHLFDGVQGFCHLRKDIRVFRLDCIVKVELSQHNL